MKLTVVGCGDAFGSGGQAHTCFRLDASGRVVLVDFGASALCSWKRLGFDTNDIDAIVISHLHGDHFGGIPFLLLESQFLAKRVKPLHIAGPHGIRARLEMVLESLFPGSTAVHWTFHWEIMEIAPRHATKFAGFQLETFEVIHPAGALATAVRLSNDGCVFAYSGDSAWTDILIEVAAGADLFIVECYSGKEAVPNHIDWPTLRSNLPRLKAKRTLVTHMSHTALACTPAMEAEGLVIAHDGLVLDL